MRILIAVGGESHSDIAAEMGAYVVAATGASPILLTVRSRKTTISQTQEALSRATKYLSATPELESKVRTGQPVEEIVAEAAEGKHDLIIIGDRPSHWLARRILGSTVGQVIGRAPCPVMVARQARPLQRILVCEGGRQAPLLERLTSKLGPLLANIRQITVLHVMSYIAADPSIPGWELQADAEDHIRHHTPEGNLLLKDAIALTKEGLRPQVKIRHGLVVDEIVSEAREGDYDLMVIGAHQQKGWQCLLLDDLAHQIILHTTQSLLVVV